jgi:hypothetical protein
MVSEPCWQTLVSRESCGQFCDNLLADFGQLVDRVSGQLVGSFVIVCWQILDSLLAELVDSLWADLLDNCRIVLWTRLDSLTSACVSSGDTEFFLQFSHQCELHCEF